MKRMKQFRYVTSNEAGYLMDDGDGKLYADATRYFRYIKERDENGLKSEQWMEDAKNQLYKSAYTVTRECRDFIEKVGNVISVTSVSYTVGVNYDGSYTTMECVTIVYEHKIR